MSYSNTPFHFIPTVFIDIDTHSTNYTMSSMVRQFTPSGRIQIIPEPPMTDMH